MDDGELMLIAKLSFIRSDLEQFVFSVLASIDRQFGAVAWPANEADLGNQLVILGRALEWHAALRVFSSAVDDSTP